MSYSLFLRLINDCSEGQRGAYVRTAILYKVTVLILSCWQLRCLIALIGGALRLALEGRRAGFGGGKLPPSLFNRISCISLWAQSQLPLKCGGCPLQLSQGRVPTHEKSGC